jgi:hypothetical protein
MEQSLKLQKKVRVISVNRLRDLAVYIWKKRKKVEVANFEYFRIFLSNTGHVDENSDLFCNHFYGVEIYKNIQLSIPYGIASNKCYSFQWFLMGKSSEKSGIEPRTPRDLFSSLTTEIYNI